MTAPRWYQHAMFTLLPRLALFMWRVLSQFLHNRGMLLAGGVGFNILLSTIPLFALMVVAMAQVVDEDQLINVITLQARHIAPTHAEVMLESVRALLDSRDAIGIYGIPVLLLFSSFAFRMLEDALALIFRKPDVKDSRSLWVSFLLPYAFMLVLSAALLALAMAVSLANTLNGLWMAINGKELPLASLSDTALNLTSFLGVFLLFSAIYKVLPVVRISLRRALAGGFAAALMWEGVRIALVYYFANLSLVSAVYGPLATLIVVLLSLEIGAVILLLGAQVIAELEHNCRLGLAWHQDPRRRLATASAVNADGSPCPSSDESAPSDPGR
ncbi:YihY/virulence factor BrkB family protein [Halomonas sp. DP5Y7-2]|uniref:YihY/virulence factor BrkB family protein n=1 Tax=Halomonas sp. DP5Y7-2 TaxID=2859076 RepID=UPI001C990DE4|nr:YihY/virulence factor BrkB family protein [Halomonas sp. DP5Y7-2]MBY5984520.1 YihY/virulence factor BrkB family protein [Halomonas sp. DP5Y7-2]